MPSQTESPPRELPCRLRVRLDGSRGTQAYAPGDTIRGTVSLEAGPDGPLAAPRARALLSLRGRSRCTISRHHDESAAAPSTRHSSAFELFDPDATTGVLLDGPLHVERGGALSWPFAVTIPPAADGAVLAASRDREASYTPIDGADQPLPGSFAVATEDTATSLEADVTYALHVSLTLHTSPEASKSAAFPVCVRPRAHAPPVSHFDLRTCRRDDGHTFRSHRLVPGMPAPSALRRHLRPESIPRLGVRYEVDAPGVIQPDSPLPLPLRMRALPDASRTSPDVDGIKQSIRVEEVYLSVDAETGGRAGEGGERCEESARGSGMLDYRLERFEGRRRGVYLQLAFGDPTLDLGSIMGMRFFSGAGGVAPAFTALNISHGSHRLSWCITVSFDGEEHIVRGSRPVKILPPASGGPSAWGTAPPEEALPPPYDSVEHPPEYTP